MDMTIYSSIVWLNLQTSNGHILKYTQREYVVDAEQSNFVVFVVFFMSMLAH